MTQHLSVSAENGPDLGWKNLFRPFHLFNGTFFPLFLLFFFLLKAVDPWRLVLIVSDMMYHTLKNMLYVGLWQLQATIGLQPDVLFCPGTLMLTMVLNLANLRTCCAFNFGSRSRLTKRLQLFSLICYQIGRDLWQSEFVPHRKSNLRDLWFCFWFIHVERVTGSCDV